MRDILVSRTCVCRAREAMARHRRVGAFAMKVFFLFLSLISAFGGSCIMAFAGDFAVSNPRNPYRDFLEDTSETLRRQAETQRRQVDEIIRANRRREQQREEEFKALREAEEDRQAIRSAPRPQLAPPPVAMPHVAPAPIPPGTPLIACTPSPC
jgi:hypothetical protein